MIHKVYDGNLIHPRIAKGIRVKISVYLYNYSAGRA